VVIVRLLWLLLIRSLVLCITTENVLSLTLPPTQVTKFSAQRDRLSTSTVHRQPSPNHAQNLLRVILPTVCINLITKPAQRSSVKCANLASRAQALVARHPVPRSPPQITAVSTEELLATSARLHTSKTTLELVLPGLPQPRAMIKTATK